MESSMNIPPSIDGRNKSQVGQLKSYIAAVVMALAISGCATPSNRTDVCADPSYSDSLARNIGQSEELLRIKKTELGAMRNTDNKNKVIENGTSRQIMSGEIKQLELNIKKMNDILKRCNQYQSRMRYY